MKYSAPKSWRRQRDIQKYLSQEGEVLSYTFIQNPPEQFESNEPYYVVMVELDNSEKLFGQMAEGGEVSIGSRVRTAMRRTIDGDAEGLISYGIKFIKLN